MGSTANYKPTPGAALPAILLSPASTAEQSILSAVATPAPVAGGTVPTFYPLQVSIPAGSILEQQEWSGSASGYVTAGVAGNLTLKLYASTASAATPVISLATAGSVIGTSGAVAIASAASSPFLISIDKAIYDSVSGKLAGVVEMIVNGTLIARSAFVAALTGVNNSNNPVLTLSLSAQFSVANAANAVHVQDFEIDF
jgi:hypothetical protein